MSLEAATALLGRKPKVPLFVMKKNERIPRLAVGQYTWITLIDQRGCG